MRLFVEQHLVVQEISKEDIIMKKKHTLVSANLGFFGTNNMIDRSGAEALIPEEASREIIQGVPKYSAIMQLATKAPNMSRKQRRVPVLSTLPTAYFVDGDTGLKQTSEQAWANKYFNAEELAVIIPIPEAVRYP